MSPTILLLTLALALPYTISGKVKKPTCNDFSKNAEFIEHDAIGNWHLFPNEVGKSVDAKCVQFSAVDEKEQKNLESKIGKYIPDMKWQAVTLKMQIPCPNNTQARAHLYYLEKQDGVGMYKTLDMPPPTEKQGSSAFQRYTMRMKSVSEHLVMMDCHENIVFLLSKQPQAPGAKLDERLAQVVKDYWIEE